MLSAHPEADCNCPGETESGVDFDRRVSKLGCLNDVGSTFFITRKIPSMISEEKARAVRTYLDAYDINLHLF